MRREWDIPARISIGFFRRFPRESAELSKLFIRYKISEGSNEQFYEDFFEGFSERGMIFSGDFSGESRVYLEEFQSRELKYEPFGSGGMNRT